MLLAINSDGEWLGCGSRLGLSTLLFALLCRPLRTKICGLSSLPPTASCRDAAGGQAADLDARVTGRVSLQKPECKPHGEGTAGQLWLVVTGTYVGLMLPGLLVFKRN